MNITINSDEEWEGFCRALDDAPWCRDEKFSDAVSRYKNYDELDKLIEEWTSQRSDYESDAPFAERRCSGWPGDE